MVPSLPALGTFNALPGRKDGASTTAFTAIIPPFPVPLSSGLRSELISHVTKVIYTTAGTAHTIGIMRPFNWATFAADAAAAQATVVLNSDPGLYATAANWKYNTVPGGTPRVANNIIAAGDWVVYQAADGTLVADTVASGNYAALVLTTNVPTGGVKAGGILWFFGVIGDSDPNTGFANPQTKIAATSGRDATWADPAGVVAALHPGDPMLFYSPDNGADGSLEACTGYWAKY